VSPPATSATRRARDPVSKAEREPSNVAIWGVRPTFTDAPASSSTPAIAALALFAARELDAGTPTASQSSCNAVRNCPDTW